MTILVAIAPDAVSDDVLDTAITLAEGLDEELYVVHLLEEELADAGARQLREELRQRLGDAPVVATVALEYVGRSGRRNGTRVAQELLELAADVDITHIVMGHRHKGLKDRLTGGTAAFAVLDTVSVPVTIVPEVE
ncbi:MULTISPECIES: universal stress protein [Haloarcula]|uniref:universal stress protein n=1 Tax=Haloarcula TaxID=2237 RepID=UPI0023EB68D1|nr:universal stress protein [Halomicroarcula sp. XH51]